MKCARLYLNGIFIDAGDERDHLLIEEVASGFSRKLVCSLELNVDFSEK